jgi:hypothetical protein
MGNLSILLLLLLPFSTPSPAAAERGAPDPERVYRQLRGEPAIRTREEALGFLAATSPGALWRSSKLCVDGRVKDLLSQAGFESLDEAVQAKLHTGMLEIRSSFWAEDLEKLASAGEELREVWESGGIASGPESPEDAERLQDRLLALVEEVEIAVALQRCAREERDRGTAAYLDCVVSGGSGD